MVGDANVTTLFSAPRPNRGWAHRARPWGRFGRGTIFDRAWFRQMTDFRYNLLKIPRMRSSYTCSAFKLIK